MKIKRDKKDKVFSDLVRGRAGWCCEFCHTYYLEGDRRGLECSHIVTRSRKGTRWHPSNAFSLCTGHHAYFTGRPLEFTEWVHEKIGREKADEITALSRQTFKTNKPILEDIYKNLKAEWQRMETLRNNGETGRIEFRSPYEA